VSTYAAGGAAAPSSKAASPSTAGAYVPVVNASSAGRSFRRETGAGSRDA
jgi:hypothetical protein